MKTRAPRPIATFRRVRVFTANVDKDTRSASSISRLGEEVYSRSQQQSSAAVKARPTSIDMVQNNSQQNIHLAMQRGCECSLAALHKLSQLSAGNMSVSGRRQEARNSMGPVRTRLRSFTWSMVPFGTMKLLNKVQFPHRPHNGVASSVLWDHSETMKFCSAMHRLLHEPLTSKQGSCWSEDFAIVNTPQTFPSKLGPR